jgi:cytochrome bd-type quinol oxidase subunit 1
MNSLATSPTVLLVGYCLLALLAALAGGALPSLFKLTHTRLQVAVSFVAGLMLGLALLGLLPHASHELNSIRGGVAWLLGGFLVMFFLQRFLPFHHHDMAEGSPTEPCGHTHSLAERSARSLSWMGVALGLSLHSVFDGLAMAAALVSGEHGHGQALGLGTALAVILHKPFGALAITTLMAAGGATRFSSNLVNLGFALVTPLGALLFYLGAGPWAHTHPTWLGCALAFCAEITDFWAMVFNPSAMGRLFHTLCGAWQAGAFLVVSVSAWYLLKRKCEAFARASLRVGLIVGLIASVLQLVSGHSSAQGVAKNQPVKLAAFEGLYETESNAPLTFFGWVDEKKEKVIGPKMPGLLSFLAHNDRTKPVTGLRQAAPNPADRPPVSFTFQLFHLMVGLGFCMILTSALGFLYFRRGWLLERRWLLRLLVLSVLGPQIANQAGWFAAEVGRQPWIVQGLLRTSEGLSAVVKANAVITSIILFSVVYLLLFAVFVYLLNDKIQHGPDDADLVPSGKLALPERSQP